MANLFRRVNILIFIFLTVSPAVANINNYCEDTIFDIQASYLTPFSCHDKDDDGLYYSPSGLQIKFINIARNNYGLTNSEIRNRVQFCFNQLHPIEPFNPNTALNIYVPLTFEDPSTYTTCFDQFPSEDNCPYISNPNQGDLNGDGVGDACDNDADGDGFTSDNDFNDLNAYLSTDPDDDGIDSSGASHYSDNVCLRSPQCNENDPCILVCYVPPQDNCPNVFNADQANLDSDNEGDACDLDIDGDKIINTIETAAGTNPNDPSDGDQAELSALEALGINKQVPAMGGIGLLALGLSMLGLGAVRLRKR